MRTFTVGGEKLVPCRPPQFDFVNTYGPTECTIYVSDYKVDRQYETAIETALGGRIQNIVTDSEETAKRLIEHLKRNRYGRATFLPLTSAGNAKRWEPGPVMQEDGVIGIAADLVHTEPRYEGLIRSLLGRDIVVRDIDRAIAIERKYHYSFRIVTPEGELLNPGGSMSGGAYKNSSNLLGRKREIEELEASVEKILKQADRTQAELDQANMVHEEVKAEIESLRGEEQTLLLEKNTEEMALARLTEKREELEDSLNDLATERIQLKQQTAEINDSRRSLNTDIAGIEDRRAAMEQEIASKNVQLEEERRRREDLAGAQQEAQLAYSAAFQRNGFIAENIRRLKEELKKLSEEREALEGGTEDTKSRISEKEAAIREDEARIERQAANARPGQRSRRNISKSGMRSRSGEALWTKTCSVSARRWKRSPTGCPQE